MWVGVYDLEWGSAWKIAAVLVLYCLGDFPHLFQLFVALVIVPQCLLP